MITAKQDAIEFINHNIRDIGALAAAVEGEEGYDEEYASHVRRIAGWLLFARQYLRDANDYEIATPVK